MRTAIAIAAAFVLSVTACQVAPTDGPAGDAEEMAPSKNIRYGKACDECAFNIKHGLNCTKPSKKVCGAGDLDKGSGWCVARKTDTKGYCSGRCEGDGDCPSGFSCSDLKTGVQVCTR